MDKIGVRELRQHASRHLERGKAGVGLEVTERGRLIAVLAAPGEPRSARDRLVPAGSPAPASQPFPLPRRNLMANSPSSAPQLLQEMWGGRPG